MVYTAVLYPAIYRPFNTAPCSVPRSQCPEYPWMQNIAVRCHLAPTVQLQPPPGTVKEGGGGCHPFIIFQQLHWMISTCELTELVE